MRIIRGLPKGLSFGGGCGRSSGVERNLAKVDVEGSNPFARSKFFKYRNVQKAAKSRGSSRLGLADNNLEVRPCICFKL